MKIRPIGRPARYFLMSVVSAVLIPNIAYPSDQAGSPILTGVTAGDSRCHIEWESDPNAAGYNLYLKQGDGRFRTLNETPLTEERALITDLVNGEPYTFAVTTVGRKGEESDASVTGLVIPAGNSYRIIGMDGGDRAADYILFSTPFRNERDNPRDIFSYQPDYDNSRWRIFSAERDGYKEFGDIPSIKPGKGYWFLSKDPAGIFLSGKTVNAYEPFIINLHPGWNIIGSPFLFPVKWSDVVRANGGMMERIGNTIWGFEDGGFYRAASLDPFKGYYIYNGNDVDKELLIPPLPTSTAQVAGQEGVDIPTRRSSYDGGIRSPEGWSIELAAEDGFYRDGGNIIGIDPGRLNDDERYASMEPPAWPQHLSLYFKRAEDPDLKRSTDIKSRGIEWTMIIEGGETDQLELTWKKLEGNPSLTIEDRATGIKLPMNKDGKYTFKRSPGERRLFTIRTSPLETKDVAPPA